MFNKKEYHRIYGKKYWETHKFLLTALRKEYNKEYRRTHKKERAKYNKKYMKKWRILHCKEIKEYRNKYLKNKRETDINFKLLCNLRTRLNHALKTNIKSKRTLKLLGCNTEFFKKYYQDKFSKGMTWNKVMNGEIQIDHIIPCCKFDLSKPSEQTICFHYTNLQPMWAKDNIKKGGR
jgi:hypothetical protein